LSWLVFTFRGVVVKLLAYFGLGLGVGVKFKIRVTVRVRVKVSVSVNVGVRTPLFSIASLKLHVPIIVFEK